MLNNSSELYLRMAAKRMLQKRKRKKLPRPLAPKSPIHLEREYQRDLGKYVEAFAEAIRLIVLPQLPTLVRSFQEYRPSHMRGDAAPDDLDKLINEARLYFSGKYSLDQLRQVILARGFDVSSWNISTISKNIEKVIGINPLVSSASLPGEMALFAATNVGLAESLTDKAFTDVTQEIFRGFQGGQRAETIAESITKYIDPSVGNVRNRANLIARDQINKLNGQLTQVRQSNLGIKRYTWRTMGDERVRGAPGGLYPNAVPSHFANEGKVFSWDDPPTDTGHPGDDFQCRCYAEPYLEDLVPGINGEDDDE